MSDLRVAVLGASGIGRNHARWFAGHGCDIVGFLGSSPETVQTTAPALAAAIGRPAPPGYTSLDLLLAETRPDAVCISNPPELHYEHAQQCLRFGAHVLCEKPLVGDDHKTPTAVVREAQALVELARSAGVLLCTQMQYAVAAEQVLELAGAAGRGRPLTHWSMEMEAKMVRPGRGHELIWIDLSPHPLSVLQKMGEASIEWDTVRCAVQKLETHVHCKTRFTGSDLACDTDIIVRCNPQCVTPLRRFTINGRSVDYQARKNAAGDFKAFFRDQSGNEVELPDLVDSLIGNFVKACRGEEELLVTGQDGARNVEWQLGLLAHRS